MIPQRRASGVQSGQTWQGNVDGTIFHIDGPAVGQRSGGDAWQWRTDSGKTGTHQGSLITHACTLIAGPGAGDAPSSTEGDNRG